MAAGEHTFGQAYPAGTWPDEGAGEKEAADKGEWELRDGNWVNTVTGEVYEMGDKDKDPSLSKEGDWGNKEDWADWDKKDDDSAKTLAASIMAVVAASMNIF